MVMEFLYHGGCATLKVNQSDVLELMAAANFFQLDGLLRFCEAQCSAMIDLDNIVSTYIHAKVFLYFRIIVVTMEEQTNDFLVLLFRFTTLHSYWNTAKAFYCKTWSHC